MPLGSANGPLRLEANFGSEEPDVHAGSFPRDFLVMLIDAFGNSRIACLCKLVSFWAVLLWLPSRRVLPFRRVSRWFRRLLPTLAFLRELQRLPQRRGGILLQAVLASEIVSEVTGRLALCAATPSDGLVGLATLVLWSKQRAESSRDMGLA